MTIEKSRQFCRDYFVRAFVLHFGVKHDIFMSDFKFCFYLIFHKPSKYKDFKEKCDFTIFLKECRQWDLNPHVVAHNRF